MSGRDSLQQVAFDYHYLVTILFFYQVHRGAVSGLPRDRVQCLGPLGEPRGSRRHDSHILYHRLSETQIHQKIHLTEFFFC